MHSTRATILRLTRLTDTSLIVTWLSGGHGLIKTVAKGARRPKSPFAGSIDLFFGGDLVFEWAKRGDLHHLREVSIHSWREGLRKSYDSMLLAGYCCQLIEAAVEPEHPDDGLHDLLDRALDHLDGNPASFRALRHFERELARLLGVSHQERSADQSLADLLGRLPATREALVERLHPNQDFRSSGSEMHR
ncbi:MAG: DNA repair protein RecO [Verrucomicrobiae bacterium]|nr:DNA repair protein RecO [Verrucomicrobiae bacterium]MCP5533173.1 DNA repair protein RecO [Akkermansiaceae bacterium]MCP5545213.1 DNA repair protein RecO [Akkermansiaceae bacterium]MCP5548012.1 DNA repair protein RecO [Akkermansiaceae bacterium]